MKYFFLILGLLIVFSPLPALALTKTEANVILTQCDTDANPIPSGVASNILSELPDSGITTAQLLDATVRDGHFASNSSQYQCIGGIAATRTNSTPTPVSTQVPTPASTPTRAPVSTQTPTPASTPNAGGGGVATQPQFAPIVPIKDITDKNLTFPQYIKQIFLIALQLGALLAVAMIVYGGFEYMTSAAGITKKDGADKIRGAVSGLILLLATYLILSVVTPCLVQITIFSSGSTAGSDCSPAAQGGTPQQPTIQEEQAAPVFSPLSGLSHAAGISNGPRQCAGGVASVKICTVSGTYRTPPEGGETCTGEEATQYLCASGVAEPAQHGQSLSPIPQGYSAGACPTAIAGDTERYCCTNRTKTDCAPTTAVQCSGTQVLVIMCRLPPSPNEVGA